MNGNDNVNLRNWGFLEPPSNYLGLQLLSTMAERPLFGPPSSAMTSSNCGTYNHHHHSDGFEHHIPIEYWMNHNGNKCLDVAPREHQNLYFQPNYVVPSETSSAHSMQMLDHQLNFSKEENGIPLMQEACKDRDNFGKKRDGGKVLKSPSREKKSKTRVPKAPRDESNPPVHRARVPKKRADVVINGVNMDIAEIHVPICSCTGTQQQCYRWGSGGWQSACCTTGLSMYPLPMSTKRRGARIAGRKMSIGAFKKVLEKLASEGYNFSDPIDLKHFWAKHGTNKFVTIR